MAAHRLTTRGSGGNGADVRFLFLALVFVLSGCVSSPDKARRAAEKREIDSKKQFTERSRKNAMGRGEVQSEHWAAVVVPDYTKEFNPATARFGNRSADSDKAAHADTFRFTERFRTKEFASKEFGAKSAWLGKLSFATKDAPTKEAREAGKTAASKSYDTETAREAGKTAALPIVPDGERKFLGKEADKMKRGIRPEDQGKFENAWTGNLDPMSIEDVKKLLNKN